MKIGVFTKSFQDRPIPEVCDIFRELGVDGLDLTVRPGGHIEPKDVAAKLPAAVRDAQSRHLEVLMLTTGIVSADADAERLLGTAGELGIDRIKLGYFRYRQFGTLREQLDAVRRQLEPIAALARKHGVRPCVHIHSDAFLPSHGTQLYEIIRDFEPGQVGAYVDMLHTVKEGSGDGWRQGIDLLAPWISLVAVKNFSWQAGERDANGQRRWHTQVCPLADGISPIADYLAALNKLGYDGTYSLHSEYKGRHSFQDLDTDGCIRQTAADLAFFKKLAAGVVRQ